MNATKRFCQSMGFIIVFYKTDTFHLKLLLIVNIGVREGNGGGEKIIVYKTFMLLLFRFIMNTLFLILVKFKCSREIILTDNNVFVVADNLCC